MSTILESVLRKAFSFVINGEAYVGGGRNYSTGDLEDFYRYNPESDAWTKLADFPDWKNTNCAAFSINNLGYVVGGNSSDSVFEYNPTTDKWKEKNDFPSGSRARASSFVINNIGYVGTGDAGNVSSASTVSDLWEYDSELDNWNKKANLPINMGGDAVGFTLGDKGCFANGDRLTLLANSRIHCFVYDPLTDSWERKVNFLGESKGGACSFVIDDNAYIVGGSVIEDNGVLTITKECWQFQAK